MKDMQMKKEIVLSLKPMTKTSKLNDLAKKSKEDVFRRVHNPKWPRWRLEGVFTWTVNIC